MVDSAGDAWGRWSHEFGHEDDYDAACADAQDAQEMAESEWMESQRKKIVWVCDERNPRARSRTISDDYILSAVVDCLATDEQCAWLTGGTVPVGYPGRALADYAVVLVLDGQPCVWACRASATRSSRGRRLPGPEAIARRCLPELSMDMTGDRLLPPPWRRGATETEIAEYLEELTCHLIAGGYLPKREGCDEQRQNILGH